MQRIMAESSMLIVSMKAQLSQSFWVLRQFLQSPSWLESPSVYSIRPMGLPHCTQLAILAHIRLKP